MAKKAKRLCKWKEGDIAKKFDEFIDIVKNPTLVCKNCGRKYKLTYFMEIFIDINHSSK